MRRIFCAKWMQTMANMSSHDENYWNKFEVIISRVEKTSQLIEVWQIPMWRWKNIAVTHSKKIASKPRYLKVILNKALNLIMQKITHMHIHQRHALQVQICTRLNFLGNKCLRLGANAFINFKEWSPTFTGPVTS